MNKKLFAGATALLGSVGVALAEGTTGASTAYSGSIAETIVNNSQSTIENFLTGAGPAVAAIVAAGLGLSIAIGLVAIMRRAFGAGKGR